MFMIVLQAIENLALAVIVGGAVVMATAVRPILSAKLASSSDSGWLATLEEISIHAWNKYLSLIHI